MFEYHEYVGISKESIEGAIKNALDTASKTKTVSWFEVQSIRGRKADSTDSLEFQVTVKFGCKV